MLTHAPAAARSLLAAPSRAPVPAPPGTMASQREDATERACACGGGCPRCVGAGAQPKLLIGDVDDPAEREADAVAAEVMRTPAHPAEIGAGAGRPIVRRVDAGGGGASGGGGGVALGPGEAAGVDAAMRGGEPLPANLRATMEPRFGADFADVRIHRGSEAAASAAAIGARAYTLGRDVVFGAGQYDPSGNSGRHLLAHELAHVRQQRGAEGRLQRTPARQVSCANSLPLRVPGQPDVADPVGIITAAENRAIQMMEDVLDSLEFTRRQIIGGAPAAWPTISDALATGLRLMGLDPDDAAIWTAPEGTGTRSVPLLMRRLRLIRGTIGAGSFFFFCLGTGRTRLGGCAVPAGTDICDGAVLTTCAGEFLTAFCPDFWSNSAEDQAARIIHESAHNFALFIGHTGRFTNAECFARLVQVFAGVPDAVQRVDLCPDP